MSVTPTASVSATSQNVSTTLISDYNYAEYSQTYLVTVTNQFLASDAPWCVEVGPESRECPVQPRTTPTSTTVSTRYFAPLTIQPPSSCTKTSFSYTSSQQVYPGNIETSRILPEATESAQAWFITTYVVTISTDLGGQAVTTSLVDVYLSADAVRGIVPEAESILLTQCVDPSISLCATSSPALQQYGCGALPITYPPATTAGHAGGGGGGGGGGTQTGGSSQPQPTTTKSNAPPALGSPARWALTMFMACSSLFLLL